MRRCCRAAWAREGCGHRRGGDLYARVSCPQHKKRPRIPAATYRVPRATQSALASVNELHLDALMASKLATMSAERAAAGS